LQTASLLLVPSGYKSGKVYSQIPTDGDGDLTFTRASDATRVNSDGEIETVTTGVPRLDYSQGSCPALLLEPQRTNLALRSEEFNNASWVKAGVTITQNTTISPDGTTDGDTFAGNGALGAHEATQSINFVNGTTYTLSIYAKKNTNNFIQLIGGGAAFGLNVWANFDLNSGLVGSVGTSTTASIVNAGNGWYRCVISATATATSSANIVALLINSSTSLRGELNSLSTSIFLWGAQLEAGAYATTYIPTTTASATRIVDAFTRDNIYTNNLITSSGGTWFVEIVNNIAYTRDAASQGIAIGDSSTTIDNGFLIVNTGTGRQVIQKIILGIATDLYTTLTGTVKIAIKWNGTTADVFVNGTKQVTATAFTTTIMEFLNCFTTDVPKFIQQMALYPTPLSDTDCQLLTT
jgi:hypothetical protein